MKKTALSALLLVAFLSPICQAEEASDTPAPKKQRTEAEQKKLDETRKRISEKKQELNGSKWELTLGVVGDPKARESKDTFTFQDGKFYSEGLSKRGFVATNYTVSLPSQDSDSAVWETMQTGKEGLAFIRGEWTKDKMQGNISEQLDGGKTVREHYFTTAARTAIPPTSEKKEESAAETKPQEKSPNSLVSNEKEPTVAAFQPGTTDEQ